MTDHLPHPCVNQRFSAPRGPRAKQAAAFVQCRLKYCPSRSCFSAAARLLKVPRFLRLPVLGFFLREYKRYPPDLSLLIILLFVGLPFCFCYFRSEEHTSELQ